MRSSLTIKEAKASAQAWADLEQRDMYVEMINGFPFVSGNSSRKLPLDDVVFKASPRLKATEPYQGHYDELSGYFIQ